VRLGSEGSAGAGIHLKWQQRNSRAAKEAIDRYIDNFYSSVRRHSTLNYISPVQFEKLVE
jgi:transposase InsO family protein